MKKIKTVVRVSKRVSPETRQAVAEDLAGRIGEENKMDVETRFNGKDIEYDYDYPIGNPRLEDILNDVINQTESINPKDLTLEPEKWN